jgi:serine/threonine-protein kinase
LADHILRKRAGGKTFDPVDVAELGVTLAIGLQTMHESGAIHRDIKPSNIRLTSRGEVKLMDFGIVMDTENHTLTRPGMMVGSPSYLSPEQVLGDPLNYQSDIFLLGICFYEMLTGTRPFREEGNRTIFQKIRDCDFIPAIEMNRSIPKRLNRIIEKCLEKDPRDRFENVGELIQELESFLGASRSSRIQDMILRFFDEEALLTPAVAYLENSAHKNHGDLKTRMTLLFGAAILILAGFFLGYFIARSSPVPQSLPHSAKPLK